MPDDPVERAQVLAWMFWEQNQHEGVIAVRAALLAYASRAHQATPEKMAELLERGHELLGQMEDHLSSRHWLGAGNVTVADIALYAYTHSSGERGGFVMSRFPAINRWIDRIATLPGHVALMEIPS